MVQAIFNLTGKNPSSALIVGGILMLVLSAVLDQIDPSTAAFLRQTGWSLIIIGVGLNILWLLPRFFNQ